MKYFSTLTAFVIGASTAMGQSHFKFFEPVEPPRQVQVMAHRGMAMIAPENSLQAVLACADDFVEWAEVDVRLTKDGQHVVIHNDSLDATTNGQGRVADHTLAELKELDAGAWFAPRFAGLRLQSLAEVLAAAKGKVNLYLDCKRVDPELLVREIRAAGMESQVVVYDEPAVLAKVRAASGGRIATLAKFHPREMKIEAFVKEVDPAAVELDADDVTPELCREFHERGIKVEAKVLGDKWDNPATWNKVIEAGVDWLQTDDPAGVRFTEVRRRVKDFPVKISCHRGANRYAPENTVAAIHAAAALGADYIEIDIRTTSDGKFVLMHDGTVNHTTNGTGSVRQHTAEEIAKLDAGAKFSKEFATTRVPTFDEGLVALGDQSSVYLDAKDISPEALLAALHKHGLMDRHVVFQSPDYGRRSKSLDPNVRMLLPLKRTGDFDKLATEKPFGFDTEWEILSKELIDRCHAAGIQVFSDALGKHEKVEDYRQAIGWGLDVIQTDHPLKVLRAVELETAH